MTVADFTKQMERGMWPILGTYLIIYLFQLNIRIWTPILTPVMPHVATSTSSPSPSGDEQEWRLDGQLVKAHHITSTAPAYGGDQVAITGWDAEDKVIWSRTGIHTFVRVK